MLMFDCDWPDFSLEDGFQVGLFGITLIAFWWLKKSKGFGILGFNFMWWGER